MEAISPSLLIVSLILDNPKSKPPARIERWNLRLQGYDFDAVHTSGISNPSDFLSRHVTMVSDEKQGTLAEDYVNFLTSQAVPRAMTVEEIQQATLQDTTLQRLADMIRQDNFEDADGGELALFKRTKDKLTVNDETNIILRDSRIVMPTSLRPRAIAIAHEGHQGLVKTKRLLREKVCGFQESTKM